MSRTPVSRALGRLVTEGFLNKIPKKGCYIPLPTPEDAEQVFSARRVVEGEAAARAALLATEEDIIWLHDQVAEDRKAAENRQRDVFSRINENLHLGIARISRNAYLEKWIRNIFWRSNIYVFYFDNFYRSTKPDVPQKTPAQHASIVKAIADHNPEEATRCMLAHINQTFDALLMGG
jgi:DNA-binding GntR family transcriptional regulator